MDKKGLDVKDGRLRQLGRICRGYHVDIMYAYGSRCEEIEKFIQGEGVIEKNRLSDADIGVKLSKGIR